MDTYVNSRTNMVECTGELFTSTGNAFRLI